MTMAIGSQAVLPARMRGEIAVAALGGRFALSAGVFAANRRIVPAEQSHHQSAAHRRRRPPPRTG